MSRFTLLAGVAGLFAAGCSSADEGGIGDPPSLPPPGFLNPGAGQGGTGQQVGVAGAGGAPAAPAPSAGGTGPAPVASAGTGGAPSAAGGAGGAPSAIPTGAGNIIMHDGTGWVPGSSNGLRIQGSFYPFGDATTMATLEIAPFAAPTSVCISGAASEVLTSPATMMPDYGQYWGGGLGFNLADAGNMMGAGGWDRGTVRGFSFNVTGPMVPPATQLRFKVTTLEGGVLNENGYCTNAAGGPNTFELGSLVNACWAGGAMAPALASTTAVVSLQWQVATVVGASTPFDFCIENLTAITAP